MRLPKRKYLVQRGVEGSRERVGLVLGQRLKSMKIQSMMVVSSGGEKLVRVVEEW